MKSHHVVMAISVGGQCLDITGPADVFQAANLLGTQPLYRITFTSDSGGVVAFSNGLAVATTAFSDIRARIDTLIVGGGLGVAARSNPLVGHIARRSKHIARVSSVCTGAFLLAEAGVLDGCLATTHWSSCRRLAELYPDVQIVGDRIFVQDGKIWTSAGVTAGIDLALAMVAADHSPELAREIARWLVVYLQRSGGQSQFSSEAAATSPIDSLTPVLAWIEANLDGDCSVERLAATASMSARHLTRTFVTHFSMPPAKYVHLQRLHKAKSLLETTQIDVVAVAKQCGFPRPETFHRGFRQQFGVTPAHHREVFSVGPLQKVQIG
jgi:transcriptional regulator GlxA family with amidase domain